MRVNSLSIVTKGDITRLKQGEEEKRKRYTALCVTAKPVSKDVLDRLEKLGEVQEQIMLIAYIPRSNHIPYTCLQKSYVRLHCSKRHQLEFFTDARMLSGKRLGFDETEGQCSIFYVLKVVHSMRADSEGLSGNMFRMDVLTSAG